MKITSDKLRNLTEIAATILDEAVDQFLAGQRSQLTIAKGERDFATHVDSALEHQIGSQLRAQTGIDVHGEEHGGPPVNSPLLWVIDPIDGTFNYAAGSPMAGILLGLLCEGKPVAGLTWLPFTQQRYLAYQGGPFLINGAVAPTLSSTTLDNSLIGMSTFHPYQEGPLPGQYCLKVFTALSQTTARIRMHGATGIDLAYVASGILAAAISFGDRIWDHAAGVALIEAAGGIVTDLEGNPWTNNSRSMIAAAPYVHEHICHLLANITDS